MKDQKRMLAEASLKQVPHHGWTQDAITAAVLEHPQMTISMSGLLTPIELVNWIMEDWNDQMRQKKKNKKDLNLFDAIEWRLKQVIPLVQTGKWHQGMALGLSTPLTTRSQLHEFIDIIALPNSTTIYKTALCGVFVSTELFLLTDSSPDYRETWKFLEGRLQELESGKFLNLLDTTSIPMAATSAVASSLLEGVASLLMPSFFSNSNGTSGTKESDYKPTSSQR
jgi:ubiquinone biosynthesis protein COQ9